MSNSYTPTTSAPIVSIAAWNKTDRRSGINPRTNKEFNDPHMNVKVQLNTVKLANIVAAALAKGDVSVEILGGMWANEADDSNQPMMTGSADTTRDTIEARKLAAAQQDAATMLANLEALNLDKTAVSA